MRTINSKIRKGVNSFEHPSPERSFTLSDSLILLFLLFFNLVTHTFHLATPYSRVFDETHFGSFTNGYVTRRLFHDIHPPFAKLVIAGWAYISGYRGEIDFRSSNNTFIGNLQYFSLRQAPAIVSSFLGPCGYLSMRFFGFSRPAAFLTGMFLATETMMIVEGRLILTDGFIHMFTVLTILGASMIVSYPNYIGAFVFMSLMAGITFSIKNTGLSVIVFVAAVLGLYFSKSRLKVLFGCESPDKNETTDANKFKILVEHLKNLRRFGRNTVNEIKICLITIYNIPLTKLILQFLLFLMISFSVLYACYIMHVIVLLYKTGDATFYPHEIQRTFLSSPTSTNYRYRTDPPNMIQRINKIMIIMHRSNMGITASHPSASKWYQWPFLNTRSLNYYSSGTPIILFATPLIWYPAAISPIICTVLAIFGYFYENYGLTKLIIWPVGYYASLFPFALIKRVIFIYHYLIPLIFGIFSFIALLEVLFCNKKAFRACIFVTLIVAVFGQYLFYAPFCYGLSNYKWSIRKWYQKM